MAESTRGDKHICQNRDCQKPFYDLGKASVYCPNCGDAFDGALSAEPVAGKPSSSSTGWRRGGRRVPPSFRIVSPEEAEHVKHEAATSASWEPEESVSRLSDVDST